MVCEGLIRPGLACGLALAAIALSACASSPTPAGMAGPDFTISPPWEGVEPRIANPRARLQCVPYARSASGIDIYGDAVTWWAQAEGRYPRSTTPAPGAVLAVRGYNNARRGHVAVVRDILSSRLIRVDHANWLNRGEISTAVPVMDVSANNDWREIRVWHVPGGHWGGRVYVADGFIHPFDLRGLLS
jgi:CHAP domain